MERFSFREAINHSKQENWVDIGEGNKVLVRPISPIQMDHIRPIIKRLFKKFKEISAQQKADGTESLMVDTLIDVAFSPESQKDTYQLIYSILDRPEAKVISGDRSLLLFTYDDMVQNIEIDKFIDIFMKIWEQNAKKFFERVKETGKEQPEAGEEKKTEAEEKIKTNILASKK